MHHEPSRDPIAWPPPPDVFSLSRVNAAGMGLHLTSGGRGPALLMLHGLGGSGQDFHETAQLLADRFTCYLPDLPGFGRSPKPDAPYDPPYFIEVILDLLKSLGLKRVLPAGHSMGGMLAMLLALQHPETVRGVVAVCPAGGHTWKGWRRGLLMAMLTKPGDRFRFFSDALIRKGIAMQYADSVHPSCAPLCTRITRQWHVGDRPAMERAFVRGAKGILGKPIWPRLSEMRTPVQIVVGDQDPTVPAKETNRLQASLPKNLARPMIVLPAGHMTPFERPRELAQVIAAFSDQCPSD